MGIEDYQKREVIGTGTDKYRVAPGGDLDEAMNYIGESPVKDPITKIVVQHRRIMEDIREMVERSWGTGVY